MMKKSLRIGITLGDLNGIGPEVALKALHQMGMPCGVQFVLIGSPTAIEPLRVRPHHALLWDPTPHLAPRYKPGCVTAEAGRAAAAWIYFGVRGCQTGMLDALVTAPICKEGWERAGIQYPGHTELLARLTGARRVEMMLFGGPLRVVLATRHLPLARVPAALRSTNLVATIHMTDTGLQWMGVRRRRVAVCGLNPHAGDGGVLGDEENTLITPAIRAAQRPGLQLAGPVPADTVFHQAISGKFDAVIAMYHDQGLGPLKMLAFDSGVNLTLGLPIVRTSPDHGTAFKLAGQDRANPTSMLAAIDWAIRLARRPNPWR